LVSFSLFLPLFFLLFVFFVLFIRGGDSSLFSFRLEREVEREGGKRSQ